MRVKFLFLRFSRKKIIVMIKNFLNLKKNPKNKSILIDYQKKFSLKISIKKKKLEKKNPSI